MILGILRAFARLIAPAEVKIVNHDGPILRALVTENTELRRRLDLPLVSSVQIADGRMSSITHELPARAWQSRVN